MHRDSGIEAGVVVGKTQIGCTQQPHSSQASAAQSLALHVALHGVGALVISRYKVHWQLVWDPLTHSHTRHGRWCAGFDKEASKTRSHEEQRGSER